MLSGRRPASRFQGYDAEHALDGVTLTNLTLLGEPVATPEEGRFRILPFAYNILVQ